MRIALLRTDSVLNQYQAEHGDYPDMFEALLQQAATDSEQFEMTGYDVQALELPELDGYDGFVITGSRHSVYEELQWITRLVEFVTTALAQSKKVVGICFGHQLLAHYFGGRVAASDKGWAVGVHTAEVVQQKPWMRSSLSTVSLISSHKDQVVRLPAQAEVFSSSDFCPVSGFVMGDSALAIQGHPEFNPGYAGALMTLRRELLGEETYREGIDSLDNPTDHNTVASWIINFITDKSN